MNKPIIKLKESDFETVKKINRKRNSCSSKELRKSFDKHIKDGLKYNKNTGVVRNKSGFVSKYSYKKDIPKKPSREDVIEWQFFGEIANSCSRLRQGFKP